VPSPSWEEHRAQQRVEAAAELEQLIAVAKAIVLDLRGNEQDGRDARLRANDTAYARLYWLRHKLGRITSDMGVGLPPTRAQRVVAAEYDPLLNPEDE